MIDCAAIGDSMSIERPEIVEDKHLEFLDDLQKSGDANMFGASANITEEFDIPHRPAKTIVAYWMQSFGERHAGA